MTPPPPPVPDDPPSPEYIEPKSVFQLPRDMVRHVFILSAINFFITCNIGIFTPILPTFVSREMGLTTAAVGFVVAAPSATRILINLKMGELADGYGRRPLMVGGALFSGLAGFGTAFATSLPLLLLSRCVAGVGSSATMIGIQACIADLSERTPHHIGKINSFYQQFGIMAFVVGPWMGGVLADSLGTRGAFCYVGVSFTACALAYSMLPETLKERKNVTSSIFTPSREMLDLLKDPSQRGLLAMVCGLNVTHAAFFTLVPLHMATSFDLSVSQLGLIFSVSSMSGLLGAPIGGMCADRFGKKITVVLPAAATTIVWSMVPFAPTVEVMGALLMALTFFMSLMNPAISSLSQLIAPQGHRAASLSLARQISDLTFTFAPIILGGVAYSFSNEQSFATACAIFGCCSTYFALQVKSHLGSLKIQ